MGTFTITSGGGFKPGWDAKGIIPSGISGHNEQAWSREIDRKKADTVRDQAFDSAMGKATGSTSTSSATTSALDMAKQASDLAFRNNANQMQLSYDYRTMEGARQKDIDANAQARLQISEAGATGRTQLSEDAATKRTGMSIASQQKMPGIQSAATGEMRDADAQRAQKALNTFGRTFGR